MRTTENARSVQFHPRPHEKVFLRKGDMNYNAVRLPGAARCCDRSCNEQYHSGKGGKDGSASWVMYTWKGTERQRMCLSLRVNWFGGGFRLAIDRFMNEEPGIPGT